MNHVHFNQYLLIPGFTLYIENKHSFVYEDYFVLILLILSKSRFFKININSMLFISLTAIQQAESLYFFRYSKINLIKGISIRLKIVLNILLR